MLGNVFSREVPKRTEPVKSWLLVTGSSPLWFCFPLTRSCPHHWTKSMINSQRLASSSKCDFFHNFVPNTRAQGDATRNPPFVGLGRWIGNMPMISQQQTTLEPWATLRSPILQEGCGTKDARNSVRLVKVRRKPRCMESSVRAVFHAQTENRVTNGPLDRKP